MSYERMLNTEELDRLDDLSGLTLYSAEVKRIPFLSLEEQRRYVDTAREGDREAQHTLLLQCLNWTMTKAAHVYQGFMPQHSDVMDLIGHANVQMLEALPNALKADRPIAYLMGVGLLEARQYCRYNDPMVRRIKGRPPDEAHPITVSIESGTVPLLNQLPEPDLTIAETAEQCSPEYQLVFNAIHRLAELDRQVLTASYGLFGSPAEGNQDIARRLRVRDGAIANRLFRAKSHLAALLGPYVTAKGLENSEY